MSKKPKKEKVIVIKDIEGFKCPKCGRAVYMACGRGGNCMGNCMDCHLIFSAKPERFKIKIRNMKWIK